MTVMQWPKRPNYRSKDVWAIVDRRSSEALYWNGSYDAPDFIEIDTSTPNDTSWYYTCFNKALDDALVLGRRHVPLQEVIGVRIVRPMEAVPTERAGAVTPRDAFVEAVGSLYTYAAHDLEQAVQDLLADLPDDGASFRYFALTQMNDTHLRQMLTSIPTALDPSGWRWYSHVVAMKSDIELMTFSLHMPFKHVYDIEQGRLLDT